MLDNLKKPCAECPFKKDSCPGWLGGETAHDTYHSVMTAEADFACHMTRDRPLQQMSRCRGSLLFLKQGCKSPRYNKELIEALDKITMKEVGKNILLPHHFIEHHTI